MSTGKGEGTTSHQAAYEHSDQTERRANPSDTALSSSHSPRREDDQTSTSVSGSPGDERGPTAQRDQPSESTYPSTEETTPAAPRQVIAVSASKGPAAFFNLARKFLVTDETCDLSALEGAIVSAVDAAHLLERSRLATIVRVQTSYVTVEPKRRKPSTPSTTLYPSGGSGTPPTYVSSTTISPQADSTQPRRGSSGRELRRARIVITVRRTGSYKRWLEENPLQAIIAGDGDDELVEGTATDKPASK